MRAYVFFGLAVISICSVFILPPLFSRVDEHETILNQYIHNIREEGPTAAYANLAEDLSDRPSEERHRRAHIFGESLYQLLGFNGVSVCDEQFTYGCLHELTAQSLYAHGMGALSDLVGVCKSLEPDKRNECEHGLGHGILAYYGYSLSNVEKSLQHCSAFSDAFTDVVGGCNGGVFMEFNLQAMKGDGVQPREVIHNDLFYPCRDVDTQYSLSCIYKLPQWWDALYSELNTPQRYPKLATLCSTLGVTTREQHVCYAGIGVVAFGVSTLPEKIEAACTSMQPNDEAVYACLANAAYRYRMIDESKSSLLCNSLSGYQLSACISAANKKPIPLFPNDR